MWVPAPLMFAQPHLLAMQVLSDSADTCLQQSYIPHETIRKLRLLVESSTGNLDFQCSLLAAKDLHYVAWVVKTNFMVTLWSVWEKEGVLELQRLTCCMYGGQSNFNQDSADMGSGDNVDIVPLRFNACLISSGVYFINLPLWACHCEHIQNPF